MNQQGLLRDFNNEEGAYRSELLMVLAMRRELQVLGKAVEEIQRALDEKENNVISPERKLVMMNSDEVTRALKISHRTLFNYRQKGILGCTKIGGKYLYSKDDLERLIEPEQE